MGRASMAACGGTLPATRRCRGELCRLITRDLSVLALTAVAILSDSRVDLIRDRSPMKFSYFHLMPWPDLDEAPAQWPASNSAFKPERGKELYDSYIDTMVFAEQCGFDWVGCNEHHFSPYGLMANCNLIGAALVQRTSTIRLAMLG